jgi:hypothetical protein
MPCLATQRAVPATLRLHRMPAYCDPAEARVAAEKDAPGYAMFGSEVDRSVDRKDTNVLCRSGTFEPHWPTVKRGSRRWVAAAWHSSPVAGGWPAHEFSDQHLHHPLRHSADRHARLHCRCIACLASWTVFDGARRYGSSHW